MNLDRPVNDILADAWEDLFAKLDALAPPAPFQQALIEYSLPDGYVRFQWEDGQKRRATAQLVGTAIPEPGGPPEARLLRWGWDEATIQDSQRAPAMRLKALGAEKGWEELTAPVIRLHLDRIWALCGLATILTGGAGAVMAHAQGRQIFLVIGPLQADV